MKGKAKLPKLTKLKPAEGEGPAIRRATEVKGKLLRGVAACKSKKVY